MIHQFTKKNYKIFKKIIRKIFINNHQSSKVYQESGMKKRQNYNSSRKNFIKKI